MRGLRKQRPRLAHLDDPPRYITATRLQMCSTSRRSCAMKRYVSFRRVSQVEQQRDDLRLNRDVERRHGLVGDDERRVERQRARDSDALSLAAAEFVWISRAMRPARVPPARTAPRPAPAVRRLCPMPWMTSGSSTMAPTRIRGIERRSTGPERRSACRAAPDACAALENESTFSSRNSTSPEVGSMSRRMQRPVVLLPLPDSPTSPNISPSSIEKLTSSTALTIDGATEEAVFANEVLRRDDARRAAAISACRDPSPRACRERPRAVGACTRALASRRIWRTGPSLDDAARRA